MKGKAYAVLASMIEARENCVRRDNSTWIGTWNERIEAFARENLPSGSGIDAGSKVDLASSTADRLVIEAPYHAMNGDGFYVGWRDYRVIVTPSLAHGINVRVQGRDYNGVKDYLADVYREAFMREIGT